MGQGRKKDREASRRRMEIGRESRWKTGSETYREGGRRAWKKEGKEVDRQGKWGIRVGDCREESRQVKREKNRKGEKKIREEEK